MRKWKKVLSLLLLFSCCVSLLTACDFVAVQSSKKDIISYVEENYGETPHVISTVSSEKKKGNHITVYTLEINEDYPVEFTI